jgi:hypothetical protein
MAGTLTTMRGRARGARPRRRPAERILLVFYYPTVGIDAGPVPLRWPRLGTGFRVLVDQSVSRYTANILRYWSVS